MDTHVKVLAVLYVAGGILGIFSALVLMLAFAVPVGAIVIDGAPDAAFAAGFLGLSGGLLAAVALLFSLPGIIVGFGLYRLRPWARIGGIILAALSILAFPIGTAIGIYGLWVLLSREGEQLFVRPAAG